MLFNSQNPDLETKGLGLPRDRELADTGRNQGRFVADGRRQGGIGPHHSRGVQRRAGFGIPMDEPTATRNEEEMENIREAKAPGPELGRQQRDIQDPELRRSRLL